MNEADDLDLEAPTAVSKGGGTSDAARKDAGSDSEDEAAPDFGQLAGLAKKMNARFGSVAEGESMPFIPKRGEKDFEPTGFRGQNDALTNSRKAMFDVIGGRRMISSKSVAIATWVPFLNRAVVHLARGPAFGSMGSSRRVAILDDGRYEDIARHFASSSETLAPVAGTVKDGVFWPKLQSRLELLPEETLYLVERGSLECRLSLDDSLATDMTDYESETAEASWIPLSVQQAYAMMINVDGLSRPRYQLYAYLKRLGYVVQRKSVSDGLRAAASKAQRAKASEELSTEGIIADPQRPLRLVTLFDVLLYPFRRSWQLGCSAFSKIRASLARFFRWIASIASRIVPINRSIQESRRQPGLLGIGTTRWQSYDEVYDRLRIIPTTHELPAHLTRRSKDDVPPEVFFYAWRPATQFKKTDPPLPEYQIAVVDARQTALPSAFAFADLFSTIPMPLSALELDDLDEEDQREWRKAQEQRKRNDQSYGRGAVKRRELEGKKASAGGNNVKVTNHGHLFSTSRLAAPFRRVIAMLYTITRLFAHLPPGCYVRRPNGKGGAGARRGPGKGGGGGGVNVYGPLKQGRRNVIVAVNDCGTTSLLRFGEADFERWRIAGTQREGR